MNLWFLVDKSDNFFIIMMIFIFNYFDMDKKCSIVFIIAMKSEANTVLDNMINTTQKTYFDNDIVFWELFWYLTAVIICGIWKVNAARATQYAIDILWAKKIINVWFAGGLYSKMEVWNTYQIKDAVEYDFDLAELNNTEIWVLNEYDSKYLKVSTINWFEQKVLGTGDRFNDSKADYELLVNSIKADIRDME